MASTSKDSASLVKEDKPIKKKRCVNRFCTRKYKNLMPVVQMVCMYYHVEFKPYKMVCTPCFTEYIRHAKNLERKMRSGKCIMKGYFPNYDNCLVIDSDSSDNDYDNGYLDDSDEFDETKQPKLSASKDNLSPLNEKVKAGLDSAIHHFIKQNKDMINQQNELCSKYLKTEVESCEKMADNIDRLIDESKNMIEYCRHKLFDPYKPIITELGPVDLDELEKEEANKIEMVKEDVIAVNRTVRIFEADVPTKDILEYPYRPIKTELDPVDLDDLKEEETNETEMDSDIIAGNNTVCISLAYVPKEEEPLEPKEDPLEPKEEPLEPKEEPLGPKEEPLGPKEEPLGPKEEPLGPKEEPLEPKEEPLEPKEEPLEYPYQPIITELDHGDLDELKEGEANKTEMDKEDVITVNRTVCIFPDNLPEIGPLEYPPLQDGQFVYAMKISLIQPWYKAKLNAVINNDYMHIKFDYEDKLLTRKQIASYTPSSVRFPVGSRVIAKLTDLDCKVGNYFYAGVIAEPPTLINLFRYMIFFDDGYVQYTHHEDIRLIVYKSNQVWNDVHPDSKDFIQNYLQNYPDRQMVRLTKNHFVKVEHENQWHSAKVLEVDASMVKLLFKDLKQSEWLYRGSSRLWNICEKQSKSEKGIRLRQSGLAYLNKPFVEYTRIEEEPTVRKSSVAHKSTSQLKSSDETTKSTEAYNNCNNAFTIITLTLPKTVLKPRPFIKHYCNISCVDWTAYNYNKTEKMSMLATPLHFGFNRGLAYFNNHQKCVWYETPCGRTVRNMKEMHEYLIATNSTMTIEQFDFSSWVKPLSEYKVIKSIKFLLDLSAGKEFRAITCVNNINNELPPPMEYMTVRQPMSGVNINVDSNFLCGCDCTDNCQDKSKCGCWKMTIEGQTNLPNCYKDPNVGYSYRRLPERVLTGIYECNSTCKCSKLCLNRVVQQSLSQNLQLFLTEKKGWGVRCLNDIPQGSFICIYVGYLLTETDANEGGQNYGDEYLAELDYIEVVEKIKEDYECDVVLNDQDDTDSKRNDNRCVTSELSDEDYQTSEGSNVVSDILSRLRKRKKTKIHKKTKKDGRRAHVPSRVNTRDVKNNPKPPKSVRGYFGDNESVYIMDAKTSGNIGRYFNHSCNPNMFVQNVFVDTYDLRFPWVSFFALHYIQAGTELTWDYSYEVGSVPGKVMKCNCGSNNCRGRLL